MADDLPKLVGSPRDVALAEPIRDRFALAMEDAEVDAWRQFQRSRSDTWHELMYAEEERSLAFAALRARADAAWWIARRQATLAALTREALAQHDRASRRA